MASAKFRTVEAYLAAQPPELRPVLKRVREAIRKALPDAEETISYGLPAYRVAGRIVIYFGGWAVHYALYPGTSRFVATLSKELAPYEVSKGTIRLPISEPVPVRLIARIAKLRAQQITRERANKPAHRKSPTRAPR